MGSVGAQRNKYEQITGTPLIFGLAHVTKDYIDIDGYINRKSESAMLNAFAKAVDKYDKGEGDVLRDQVKFNEIAQAPPSYPYDGGYILEWEDVPSASRFVDKNGVDTAISGEDEEDVEYKDAKYYVHIRFPKRK